MTRLHQEVGWIDEVGVVAAHFVEMNDVAGSLCAVVAEGVMSVAEKVKSVACCATPAAAEKHDFPVLISH